MNLITTISFICNKYESIDFYVLINTCVSAINSKTDPVPKIIAITLFNIGFILQYQYQLYDVCFAIFDTNILSGLSIESLIS